jgi:hypothetical protein
MKIWVKVFLMAFLLSGVVFTARSQIDINSNNRVTIRHHYDAPKFTINYGDLKLDGGSIGGLYGWLWGNTAIVERWVTAGWGIETYGNAIISGDLNVMGNKHFFHPHPTDESKFIKYTALESSEALTITRGNSKTVNGQAIIVLPEHFSLVTSKDAPTTVILTPEGAPALLYTVRKSTKEIVVAMKPADFKKFKDVEFSFQVTGVRDGFENSETIVSEDKLSSPVTMRNDVQRRIDAYVKKGKNRQSAELKRREEESEPTLIIQEKME